MMVTFTKALLQQNKSFFVVSMLALGLVSTSVYADENKTKKDMAIMQQAIIKLIGHYDNTNAALKKLVLKNKQLEDEVTSLKVKLKEVEVAQQKMKAPKKSVKIVSAYSYEKLKSEQIAVVISKALHVRAEPTSSSKHIKYLKRGDKVIVQEVLTNKNGFAWAKIKHYGGYVSLKWLKFEKLKIKDNG